MNHKLNAMFSDFRVVAPTSGYFSPCAEKYAMKMQDVLTRFSFCFVGFPAYNLCKNLMNFYVRPKQEGKGQPSVLGKLMKIHGTLLCVYGEGAAPLTSPN